jgi:hypothetical protein
MAFALITEHAHYPPTPWAGSALRSSWSEHWPSNGGADLGATGGTMINTH